MRTEDPDLTPEEIDIAWSEAMRSPVTRAEIRAARRAIREDPRLRLLEPPEEDVTRLGLEIVALFGAVPPGIDVRRIARELRICAWLKTLRIAGRRRAAAGTN